MDFLNQQIDVGSLPDIEKVNWKKIEKDYLKVLRIQWLLVSLFLFAVAAIIVFLTPISRSSTLVIAICSLAVLLSAFYLLMIERSFHHRAYAIRGNDILYRHGWLIRSIDACPFNRIQHCTVNAGPFERKFGLSSLTLYTAASGEADTKISGIPEATAISVREFILKKITPYEGPAN